MREELLQTRLVCMPGSVVTHVVGVEWSGVVGMTGLSVRAWRMWNAMFIQHRGSSAQWQVWKVELVDSGDDGNDALAVVDTVVI